MSFVKADVIYDCFESITFDDQNSPKLSDNGKSGIGFQRPENSKPSWLKNKLDSESSEGETSSQSQSAYDKFNKMSFVKADVIYDCFESITFDDQNSPKLSDNGKSGIGFQRPENSKPSWLKNKLDKDKAKAGGTVDNQLREACCVGNIPVAVFSLSIRISYGILLDQSCVFFAKILFRRSFRSQSESAMASSLISSSHHVNFDSMFWMDDAALVQMFESLIATGLKEFLGCPAVFYEAALTEFFTNGSVREDGMVVSTIRGTTVEISESMFVAAFELPTEVLTDLSDVPKNLLFDARSLFSESKEQLSISCLKKELKIQYRLLHDILAKTIYVKAGEMLLRKFIEARILNFVPGDDESATDLKILDRLSDIHLFVLEELKDQSLEHGIRWDRTCCSKIFEWRIRARGAIIARSNTNTKSSCWIRTMLLVDGTWVIEPCADYWKPIPRAKLSSMVIIPSRLSYVDTLPSMREFFKLLRKIWADVCIEVAQFFASGKLLPMGSINFCRGLSVVEPVASFAPRQPNVFALRVSQFCTVFIEYSFFSSLLSTIDFSSLRAVVIADRGIDISVDSGVQCSSVLLTELLEQDVRIADSPVFESQNVHIDQNSALVAPFVQLLDEHLSSASTSETSAMHFDETDIATTVSSLPTVSTDLSTSLANIQTILSKHIDASQGGILSKLHKIEQGFRDSLRQQEEAFKTLIQGARQESRNIDNVQTLRFNEFGKIVLAQNASVFTGLADVRKEVQEMNAKVDIMSSRLDDVRKDVEATKEDISHQLLEFQSQAQANYIILTDQLGQLVDYVNRGGNAKKGEGESSRGPQPPPAVQIRDSGNACGSGDAVRTSETTQAYIDAANRQILERMMREDRERERERRRTLTRSMSNLDASYSGSFNQTQDTVFCINQTVTTMFRIIRRKYSTTAFG
ncbi:hypothetical protein F511_17950 [Dorcoceras hygrometricum]|uniref:Uncharacterized protein n=1 Tax=Dorcoceras hygrometricum TaxID=472368 RepID=A0A2Z7AI52_9LAMI|nr:hypothetical protein F511_17950 [Dorcoceras hygrometricum]